MMEFDLNKIVPGEPPFDTRQDDGLVEWVEVDGIKYAVQQEVADRIRKLEAENETLSNQYDICAQEARCMADELAALRQQQSKPVAWRFKNNSGEAVTNWSDYVPQAIESVERQAREAGGWIEYAYNRETLPAQGPNERCVMRLSRKDDRCT